MRKMMFLTLALSVMTVGSAMAMSTTSVADGSAVRVKVGASVVDAEHNPLAFVLHEALCPECRPHRGCHHDHHSCCHKPHPPKREHDMHHGGRKPHSEYRPGGGRHDDSRHPNDRPGGRDNRRGDDRGGRGNGGGNHHGGSR